MRIGGGIDGRSWDSPEEWVQIIKEMGYNAVYCPIDADASLPIRHSYRKLMKENDLRLGEVGAWANPLAADEKERHANITYCQRQLELADEMDAACCVNIVGARGEIWDGAYRDNFDAYTYELIIDSIREIIDGVKPRNAYYTIEPMPWMVPDSPESYLQLLQDVDRKQFGVHLDYTNMICSPRLYMESPAFIKKCFRLLGPYVKSIHVKDIIMETGLPCIIREVMPGEGTIDLKLVLQLAQRLGEDMTVYSEHLKSWEEYKKAVSYLKRLAEEG